MQIIFAKYSSMGPSHFWLFENKNFKQKKNVLNRCLKIKIKKNVEILYKVIQNNLIENCHKLTPYTLFRMMPIIFTLNHS